MFKRPLKADVHHKYSPSKLKRLELCPASALYKQFFNEDRNSIDETSYFAIEGTNLHDCVCYEQFEFDDGFKCDVVQRELVKESLFLIKELSNGETDRVYKEKFIEVKDENGVVLTAGTVDVIIIYNDFAIVIDHKFGNTPVSVVDNLQLITYATGVIQWANEKLGKEITEVKMCINQPRLNYVGFEDYGDYATNLERIKKVVELCESPLAIVNPSIEACRWCDVKYVCDSQQESLELMQKLDLPSIRDCTDPEIFSDFYEQAIQITGVINAIKAKMFALCANNDGEFGRYEIVTRNGRRSFGNNEDVFEAVNSIVNAEEFSSLCKPVGKAVLEKLWVNKKYQEAKEKGQKITKKELMKEFYNLTKSCLVTGSPIKKLKEKEV